MVYNCTVSLPISGCSPSLPEFLVPIYVKLWSWGAGGFTDRLLYGSCARLTFCIGGYWTVTCLPFHGSVHCDKVCTLFVIIRLVSIIWLHVFYTGLCNAWQWYHRYDCFVTREIHQPHADILCGCPSIAVQT